MPDVPVMFVEVQSAGGLVERGATGTTPQAGPGTVIAKVIDFSSDHLIDGVTKIAQTIGPSLKSAMSGLSSISVQEVSVGCAISASGSVVVAGVGAEATLTITFKIT
jgi:NTP-dependent ternary system trypsin peptidase co-occuring protein